MRTLLPFFVLWILTMSASGKPNFVITIADDHGVHHASTYGANEIQTPHI
jgi:N-sulfoglucosamine sulfohydrolase